MALLTSRERSYNPYELGGKEKELMNNSNLPIRTYSAEDSAKLAKDILRWAGLDAAMWKFLYHALHTDRTNGEANAILFRLADEFVDIGTCLVLAEYLKGISFDDEITDRITKHHMQRLYRSGLAKHISGALPEDMEDFRDPNKLIFDRERIEKLKKEAENKFPDGALAFAALLRRAGVEAGFLLATGKRTPEPIPFEDLFDADRFRYTDEWEKFLNSTEVAVNY